MNYVKHNCIYKSVYYTKKVLWFIKNNFIFKFIDVYLYLAEEQHKLHEKMTKAEGKKSVTMSLPTLSISNNLEVPKAKKTRFNAK